MNAEVSPPSVPVEAVAGQSASPEALAPLFDDLDLGDVKLTPRPKGVAQEIVCEGGCE